MSDCLFVFPTLNASYCACVFLHYCCAYYAYTLKHCCAYYECALEAGEGCLNARLNSVPPTSCNASYEASSDARYDGPLIVTLNAKATFVAISTLILQLRIGIATAIANENAMSNLMVNFSHDALHPLSSSVSPQPPWASCRLCASSSSLVSPSPSFSPSPSSTSSPLVSPSPSYCPSPSYSPYHSPCYSSLIAYLCPSPSPAYSPFPSPSASPPFHSPIPVLLSPTCSPTVHSA